MFYLFKVLSFINACLYLFTLQIGQLHIQAVGTSSPSQIKGCILERKLTKRRASEIWGQRTEHRPHPRVANQFSGRPIACSPFSASDFPRPPATGPPPIPLQARSFSPLGSFLRCCCASESALQGTARQSESGSATNMVCTRRGLR